MKVVGVELWCEDCNHTVRYDDECDAPNYGYDCKCPKCGSEKMFRSPFVVCHCGTTVYLTHGDTECDGCGQWINAFGDFLKPPEQWEED